MRHNLSSGHIVLLSNEDPDEFVAHSFGFLDRFAPADYVERDLVNQMIAASWRLARISAIECSLIEFAMDDLREKHDREFSFLDAHGRQTLSMFGNVDKETVIRMLQRYQAAASRPAAQPVSPVQMEEAPEQAVPEQNHDQGLEPVTTTLASKVIVFKRHHPENIKLQSEPGAPDWLNNSNLLRAMCA